MSAGSVRSLPAAGPPNAPASQVAASPVAAFAR